jgi:mono/diheme cytochrome c family protein
MPAVGPGSGFNLNAEKVAAVLTYVRKEFGGLNTPVSAAKVTEIRSKDGARAPITVAELDKIP